MLTGWNFYDLLMLSKELSSSFDFTPVVQVESQMMKAPSGTMDDSDVVSFVSSE